MFRFSLSLVVSIGVVSLASADIPGRTGPPGPPRDIRPNPGFRLPHHAAGVPLDVRLDPEAKVARLVVPRSLLAQLQAEQAPAGRQNTTGPVLPLPLVIGLAIALGLFGLFQLRGRARVAFASALVLAAGLAVFRGERPLEAAPPPERLAGPLLPPGIDPVEVETHVTDKGDEVVLIAPVGVLQKVLSITPAR